MCSDSPPVSTSRTDSTGAAARYASSACGGISASSTSGSRPSPRRSRSSRARATSAAASWRTASGSTITTGPAARCCHGGTVAPGTSGQQLDEPLRRQPALDGVQERLELAPAGEALSSSARQRLQQRARREQVGERQRLERLERSHGALGVGVEAAQALDVVAEELDPDRLVGVGREDVEDAAAARDLSGRRDRVLARVAALVERLEQDLGQSSRRPRAPRARASRAGAGRGSGAAGRAATRPRRAPSAPCAAWPRDAPVRLAWRGRPRNGGGPGAGSDRTAPSIPAASASVRRSCAVSSTSRSRGTTTRSGPGASSSGRNDLERGR